ncbi:MAG: dTDP-4-dehydrorhamnose reductase [Candidatus Kerfeldbacteria bacterium]
MIKTPIVITGAKGMLGQDLARVFAEFSPIPLDREELDITDAEAVKKKFEELKPGTVINAAAYNAVDEAENDGGKRLADLVNANGPKNLAEACKTIGATFVHYSTDYVFDGENQAGYTEDDEPKPQSAYALSKRLGEVHALETEGNVYIVRTCKLFGKPGVSEAAKESFIELMLRLAQEKDELQVVDEELASPTYTPDLAQQTKVLLEGDYEPGIYHITNSGACTWYRFAQEIFEQSGIEIKLKKVKAEDFPRPAARPKYSILLNTKLPRMRSWEQALADYLKQRN